MAAARVEFAERGLAGARVDRIAEMASANKAQIYRYFGGKTDLFETILVEYTRELIANLPIDATNLPQYAVAIYDACLLNPEFVRLAGWARLERSPAGRVAGVGAATADNLAAVERAQRDGLITPALRGDDILALLFSMALAWSPVSFYEVATVEDPQTDHEARRHALATAVQAVVRPDLESC